MENWGNIIDSILWWNSTFWASKMKMGPRQKQGESSVVGANHPQTRARHVGSTSHAVWNMKTFFETTHGSSCTPVDAHLYNQSNGNLCTSTPSPRCAPDRSWSMVGACLEGMPEQTQHKPARICNFKMWEITIVTIVLTIHFGATNLTQTQKNYVLESQSPWSHSPHGIHHTTATLQGVQSSSGQSHPVCGPTLPGQMLSQPEAGRNHYKCLDSSWTTVMGHLLAITASFYGIKHIL